MIDSIGNIINICDGLKSEKIISDKSLLTLSEVLEQVVVTDRLKLKIIGYFDDIDRISCKTWLLLIYVRFPINELYNYWQKLIDVKSLPFTCLLVLLKDSLKTSKTSWFSSSILINNNISKRDLSLLYDEYHALNGENLVIEKLKRNDDVTSCLNLLRFIKINHFNFNKIYEVDKLLIFMNSVNPIFKNLYQLQTIHCRELKFLNKSFPDLILMQILPNVLVIWINDENFKFNLQNLFNYSNINQSNIELTFRKTKYCEFQSVYSSRIGNFKIELNLKHDYQILSIINQLKSKIMKPRKISISIIPFGFNDLKASKEHQLTDNEKTDGNSDTSNLSLIKFGSKLMAAKKASVSEIEKLNSKSIDLNLIKAGNKKIRLSPFNSDKGQPRKRGMSEFWKMSQLEIEPRMQLYDLQSDDLLIPANRLELYRKASESDHASIIAPVAGFASMSSIHEDKGLDNNGQNLLPPADEKDQSSSESPSPLLGSVSDSISVYKTSTNIERSPLSNPRFKHVGASSDLFRQQLIQVPETPQLIESIINPNTQIETSMEGQVLAPINRSNNRFSSISRMGSPIAQGTSMLSRTSYRTTIDNTKYETISENLNNFNKELIDKMKSFESYVLDQQIQLTKKLNENMEKIIKEHDDDLKKITELIAMKQKELYKISFS